MEKLGRAQKPLSLRHWREIKIIKYTDVTNRAGEESPHQEKSGL